MNLFMANHNDHHGINDKNNSIDVNEFIGHNSDVPFSPSLSSTTFISFSLFDLTTTLTALFYGAAFVLGTIGNGLIIYIVAHYPRMRTLSNVFLASLATADLLLVCVCIPIKFIQLITYTWTFGLFMCKAIHYVQSLSAYCSVLTLTIISVERYYAIIHPVKCRATFSMRHIRKMICLTWLLSAILASPSMGVYMLVRIGDEYDSDHFWCVRIASDWAVDESDMNQKWHEARIVYEVYQICTILILPTLVMIFTYSRICTHLWIVFHRRTAMRFGHACHFLTNNNGDSNCSTGTNWVSSRSSFPINAIAFTASMSSDSTTSTTAAAHYLNRNSTILVDNSEPGNGNLFPPQTPTSISSSIKSHYSTAVPSIQSLRNSRHSYCQQCSHHFKTSDEDNQTVKQVIKMLVAVVVLFVLCWAPTLVIGLLRAFNMIAETNEGILKEIITVTFLLSYLNSVINPIIYGFMSKNFRLYFRLIFMQFWSLITTGHCIDHRHHYRHRYHNNQDNHHNANTHRIGNSKTNRVDIQTTKIQMDHMDGSRKDLQRKRQSWEFSPTTNIQNKSLSLANKHPLSSTIRMKAIPQDSSIIIGQESSATNVIDPNPMVNDHYRI
ncbi:hypothetical protein DERP_012583 [Dermatophagoides pteronyssinus]|uniref:Gastrin/cholecystokinin type B receptor-like n=2 Tax=Dermatophagoides pteronyssinus TaxID=6956 RepID=A0A6P6Y1L8_DERPT|nr:gastrin/cholecystokinin type B receptor-like [Dermatophagoides pteronyssinus]KAH9414104.1 hypothetical protein DERP_012583 [Dermatophagoides pteronyssinus]